MYNFIKFFLKKRKIKKFLEQNKINFNDYGGGLNINGLIVKEFNYLLRYISDSTINNFDNFEQIYQNKEMLINKISEECNKDILNEEEDFNISHKTAIYNQNNLKNIIIKICDFIDICKNLNLDYVEIKNSFYQN